MSPLKPDLKHFYACVFTKQIFRSAAIFHFH
ncbi:hypothetical protein EcE24377A_4950 [Escherichia coli O139:H28 str. E24377A]|uniref:Uncharacterized protein n=2 Tax=Escherichia coli TaxID=562 RepID=A7ZVP7_ECO24|nr:hypothetical protein EcHS_A4589 [Escherichia coli HS]ABV19379.1 hypothetical protein EcE24377A_4950 [Escherichia coli O139:H28 str. E24377A]EGI12352.1 conserved hypothetical protein [Escherichia coli H736]EGI42683.1 conserved hypothetical protein [Escherichia coli TA280]EGI52724.1 conserved hypothetical protein [Escherichia coli H299]OSK98594.1 hypothetical protein ECXG_02866 [Escherichia coli TA447]OSL01776.1 hypothetical protein ECUG_03890 [Escherichia coli H296]OSL23375.1 hypothetical 